MVVWQVKASRLERLVILDHGLMQLPILENALQLLFPRNTSRGSSTFVAVWSSNCLNNPVDSEKQVVEIQPSLALLCPAEFWEVSPCCGSYLKNLQRLSHRASTASTWPCRVAHFHIHTGTAEEWHPFQGPKIAVKVLGTSLSCSHP